MATGKVGYPRKPDEVHKKEGTFVPSRHGNHSPPIFKGGSVSPPACLNGPARKEWRRLAPELVRLGMFTAADRAVFMVYCQSYADFHMLTTELNKLASWTYTTETGNEGMVPEVNARVKVWVMMKEAATRFGFDPSSRASMDIGQPADGELPKGTAEDFLFGGPKVME